MRKTYILLLVVTSLIMASGLTDYQVWHAEKISKSLSNGKRISLDVDSRMRNNGSQQYYFHGDLKYHFPVIPGLTAAISFREIFSLKSDGWVREHRPNVEFTLKRKSGQSVSSLRNRFEYRIFPDKTAYRNRTLLTQSIPLPVFTSFGAYISDEIFYDFTEKEFNTNRFYLGLKLGTYYGVKPGIYSMWQSSLKNNTWTTFQVSGLKISF